jgi:hypothetical protein
VSTSSNVLQRVAVAHGEPRQALDLLRLDEPHAVGRSLGIVAQLRDLVRSERNGARGVRAQRGERRGGEGAAHQPIRPDVGELGLAA